MVAAANIQASEGVVKSAYRMSAVDLYLTHGTTMVTYNIPAPLIKATEGSIKATFRQSSTIKATSGMIKYVARGRVNDPRVRAWTFTLDGHDFYVLRLGNTETLVYDVATQQWSTWCDDSEPYWPVSTGKTWAAGSRIGNSYGSSILVGDDTIGSLFFLDPDGDYDDHITLGIYHPRPFNRVVQAQVPLRGRDSVQCWAVRLYGSIGQTPDLTNTVNLSMSDDYGNTYSDRGDNTLTIGSFNQRVEWRSLGSFNSPGRIFKITDTGAFKRLDGFEMLEKES